MKKLISVFLTVLMLFNTGILSHASEDPYQFENTIPVSPTSIKTEKTKFGKNRYYGPVTPKDMYMGWKLKEVTIVQAQILNRYAKVSHKIKLDIEFMNNYCFYFNSNTPGKFYLKIVLTSPKGRTLDISKEHLTEIYVPDSSYSFEKSKKSTLKLNKVFKYKGKIINKYEHVRPSIRIGGSTRNTETIGTVNHELPAFIVSNTSPGWQLYSVKLLKAEILEKYRNQAKRLKTSIKFYNKGAFSLTVNMPGKYTMEVRMKSPSGKIVNLTIENKMQIYTPDGKHIFLDEKSFFKKINKTYRYKGEKEQLT